MTDGSRIAALTAADVADRLRETGLAVRADQLVVERRGDRLMTALPGGRIAWFATTAEAAVRLRVEDAVLALVGARCAFRVPAVLASGPDGFAARLKAEPTLVPGVAQTLAQALAEQHTRLVEADVAGWLPTAPAWPPPRVEMEARLPLVVDDPDLRQLIDRLFAAGHDFGPRPEDRALVHSDLGLHNVAFDPVTGAVNGLFDYGDAAWADRHLDFRYLVFAAVPDVLLDAAMAVYRDATGYALDRRRILICNAMAAVGHLADRAGQGADEVVAGRTLAGDLRWTKWALDRCGS